MSTTSGDYITFASKAAQALQTHWYNESAGLWTLQEPIPASSNEYWWQSANSLETIIDYMAASRSSQYLDVISNVFAKNDGFSNHFTCNKNYGEPCAYDDEGWWAIAWIKAYDLTGEERYLDTAKFIFDDMTRGWDNVCGGGVWWTTEKTYKNAIPNELFLVIASRLHQRSQSADGTSSYLDWAQKEWDWFRNSGMINESNLVNDGLDMVTCENNGGITWSYNQGVILGGLLDLFKSTGDQSLLQQARAIADAAISELVYPDGTLREPCEVNGGCDNNAWIFKGIFMRYLGYLDSHLTDQPYKHFITLNADSIWTNNQNHKGQFGLYWPGPFDSAYAAKHSAALDAFNAAIPYASEQA